MATTLLPVGSTKLFPEHPVLFSPLTLKKRSTKRLCVQLAYVDAHYSDELKGVLTYLLTKGATIEGLASALAFRSMDAFEQSVTREGTPMPPTNLCLPKC